MICRLCQKHEPEARANQKYCFECRRARKQELANQSARRSYPRRKELVKVKNRLRYLKKKNEDQLFLEKFYSK